MVEAKKNGLFEGIYAVTGTSGTYIRSAPDKTTKNNIDFLSVTGPHLAAIAQSHAKSTPAVGAYVDLSKRPEILGTLYSKGSGTPNAHPESSERGKQIAGEFCKLAKIWLKEK